MCLTSLESHTRLDYILYCWERLSLWWHHSHLHGQVGQVKLAWPNLARPFARNPELNSSFCVCGGFSHTVHACCVRVCECVCLWVHAAAELALCQQHSVAGRLWDKAMEERIESEGRKGQIKNGQAEIEEQSRGERGRGNAWQVAGNGDDKKSRGRLIGMRRDGVLDQERWGGKRANASEGWGGGKERDFVQHCRAVWFSVLSARDQWSESRLLEHYSHTRTVMSFFTTQELHWVVCLHQPLYGAS